MIPLFINSTARYSGKSLLTLGMGLKFKRDGFRLGYFKPVGWLPVKMEGGICDQDAFFMKKALDLQGPLDHICPVVMTQELIQLAYEGKAQDLGQKILNSFGLVCQDQDIVLVEGAGSLFEGGFVGARGIELAAALDAKILLIDWYHDGIATIDSLLDAKELVGDRLIGGLINRVAGDKIDFVRRKVLPFLAHREIDILAVIPEEKILAAISIRNLAEILSGSVICRGDRLDELVEGLMVGAMSMENALKYFQRQQNIVVITGGDRLDIQLAALETPVKGIILTGGFYPNEIIVARAEERGVPLILVDQDTFAVVKRFDSMLGRLELKEEKKIEKARDLIAQEVDFPLLYRRMGLSS